MIYSANINSIQVNVSGWKTVVDDSNYCVKYNKDFVEATIHVTEVMSFSTTYQEYGASVLKDGNIDLRPSEFMSSTMFNGNFIQIRPDSYKFGRFRLNDTYNGEGHATFTYARK